MNTNQGRFLKLSTGAIVFEPPYPEATDGEIHVAVEYEGVVGEATRNDYVKYQQQSDNARAAFRQKIIESRSKLWDDRAAALSAVGIEDPAIILGERP
jgi:hypothetical protein